MLKWPGLVLVVALLLSLLLHLGSVFSEQIYAWVMQQPHAETELKKVTKKLSVLADADSARPAELAGVKPAEQQVVYLQHQPVIKKPVPVAKPAPQKGHR